MNYSIQNVIKMADGGRWVDILNIDQNRYWRVNLAATGHVSASSIGAGKKQIAAMTDWVKANKAEILAKVG